MTVTIDIDLNAKSAFVKLGALDQMFDKLEESMGDLESDLNLSIGDEIQELVTELEEVQNDIGNISSGGGSGGSGGGGDGGAGDDGGPTPSFMARNIEDRFGIREGGVDADTIRGMDVREINMEISEFVNEMRGTEFGNRGLMRMNAPDSTLLDDDGTFGIGDSSSGSLSEGLTKRSSLRGMFGSELKRFKRGDLDIGDALVPDILSSSRGRRSLLGGATGGTGEMLESLNRSWGKLGGTLSHLKPNMRKIWNLIALMIPVMVAFGTQALGVAAALGSVAAAGAGVVGLGLLGHAESMSGAMREAKKELQDFKKDLFEVFQPAMREFAPIQSSFMDFAPGELLGVSEALEGLTAYEDTIFQMFSNLSGGLERFIDIIVQNEEAISQLSLRFSGLIGTAILGFFEWLIKTADKNQDMLVDLGMALYHVLGAIFDVSMVVGHLVQAFLPLFELLSIFTSLLRNDLVRGIIGFMAGAAVMGFALTKLTVGAYALITAVSSLIGTLTFLGSGSIFAGIIMGFQLIWHWTTVMIAQFTALEGAALKAAAAMALTGVGALVVGSGALVAGSMMSSGGGRGGGEPWSNSAGNSPVLEKQTTINNYGKMDRASEQRIRDEIKKDKQETQAMAPPTSGKSDLSSGPPDSVNS